ncbi:hypothetical protein M422DRAFT_25715 [Sphaerobolus stellatus SS14]|nr:hypothetical protein M422DRAFT_25715 [Sphaerobolus stellatus SS14]
MWKCFLQFSTLSVLATTTVVAFPNRMQQETVLSPGAACFAPAGAHFLGTGVTGTACCADPNITDHFRCQYISQCTSPPLIPSDYD